MDIEKLLNVDTEKSKVLLQFVNFFVLYYVLRRTFDLVEKLASRFEPKIDLLIQAIQARKGAKDETNGSENHDAADRLPRSSGVPSTGRQNSKKS